MYRQSFLASETRRRISFRLQVIRYGVLGMFGLLALGFWYLQVVRYREYWELAENNHQRTLALHAPRGILFDREGRVLVQNRDALNISIVREHAKDLDRTIGLLAAVTGANEADVRDAVRRGRNQPAYRPIPVIMDATLAQVAAVTARRLDGELPDVIVEPVPTRRYPENALAAHLLGYVGEVKAEQLGASADLKSGDLVGQSGVERAYNALLMGNDGSRRIVVNSVGREIRRLGETPPNEGRRLRLTIDYDLQRAAEEAFNALGYAGAAVVLDPRNGEVLSYVSLPAYDPNKFAARIDPASWAALNTDRLHPLLNRAIQGLYSPGSIFKLVVATAALEEGVATPDFKVTCRGSAEFYGRSFLCHLKGGHGTVSMVEAIEKSCNVYFYTLGNMVGIDRLHKWAVALGLGTKSGIDLPSEIEGLMPSSEWKKAKTGERWYAGETISVAIGQGQVSVTPISLAVMISAVANGGTRVVPHLIREEDAGQGWRRVPGPPPASTVTFKPETVATLHEGLWRVVNGAGTGGRARIAGRDVSGKTGTAQVISIQGGKAAAGKTDMDLRDHGWFVFFAPRDNPEIAGVVFAEHAEHGSNAAPIAKYVLETYFANKDRQPLPRFQAPAGLVPAGPALAAATGPAR